MNYTLYLVFNDYLYWETLMNNVSGNAGLNIIIITNIITSIIIIIIIMDQLAGAVE